MPLGWTENGEDGEVNYHFMHPNPNVVDANLWHYEGEWILDLSYALGHWSPGDPVRSRRYRADFGASAPGIAQQWAEEIIRPVISDGVDPIPE